MAVAVAWFSREGSPASPNPSGRNGPPRVLAGYRRTAAGSSSAPIVRTHRRRAVAAAMSRRRKEMLAGNWKTSRMVAHYSAGATAERGAVARYL